MNTTEPLTEEAALWASVGEMPTDQLRRLVLADWYEERATVVECQAVGKFHHDVCIGGRIETPNPAFTMDCPSCYGTGYVPNGYADMAAALRTTAGRVPQRTAAFFGRWSWYRCRQPFCIEPCDVYEPTFDAMGCSKMGNYSLHHTAADAVRDLCRAWVKVNREGTA